MNKIISFFALVGKISIIMFVFLIVGLLIQYIIMPFYTRQGKEVHIPDVRGKTLNQAIRDTKKAGFKIIVDDERFDMTAPDRVIIDQLPPAGAISKKGRRIHVSVSTGPPFSTVPWVVGQPKDDAIFTLQKAGLNPGKIKYSFSKRLFEGLIVKQKPDSGLQVAKLDSVNLVVSLGTKPVSFTAPSLVGLPEEQAVYLILKAGLAIGEKKYDKYIKKVKGVVVVQNPVAGTILKENSRVNLVINEK